MTKKLVLIFFSGLLLFSVLSPIVGWAQQTSQIVSDKTQLVTAVEQKDTVFNQDQKQRLEQATKYQRTKHLLYFLGQGYGLVFLFLFCFLGISARIRSKAEKITKLRFFVIALFIVAFILIQFIISFPLDYYGFNLEHKFNLSNQTFGGWMGDYSKEFLLSLLLFLILFEGVYFLIKKSPKRWWIYVSAVFVLFTIVLVNLAPILILPLFNVYTPLPQGELRDKLVRLSERAKVRTEAIYTMDMSKQTEKVNAMFTGLGNTKRIVLGDNLVKHLNPNEVEVVIAHEMGHNILQHIWRIIVLNAILATFGFLLIHLTMGRIVNRWKKSLKMESPSDIATLPLFLLIFMIYSLVIMPVMPGYSRILEQQADRFALEITHNKGAFVSSMQKLVYLNLDDPNPSPVVEFLLYDHPATGKRIKFAEEYKFKE
ncbi:MAG TPA: M48 family metallopeptidase [candidate division Zixibacteria bacterium]